MKRCTSLLLRVEEPLDETGDTTTFVSSETKKRRKKKAAEAELQADSVSLETAQEIPEGGREKHDEEEFSDEEDDVCILSIFSS